MPTQTLSYADFLHRRDESGFSTAGASERKRFFRPKVSLVKSIGSLEESILSAVRFVEDVNLNEHKELKAEFAAMLEQNAIRMNNMAWERWALIVVTRHVLMAGIKTLAEFDHLPEATQVQVDQSLAQVVCEQIVDPKSWARENKPPSSTSPETSKVDLASLLRRYEQGQDAEWPWYNRFVKDLHGWLPKESAVLAPLLRIAAIMEHDHDVRRSLKLRSRN